METHKKCLRCNQEKSLEQFYIRYGTNKRRGECKACWINRTNNALGRKEKQSQFYKRDKLVNPNKYKQKTAKYNSENKEAKLWSGAKSRAKKNNLDFNIEVSDIVIPKFCSVLGIKIESSHGKGPKDNSPSLDRINNKLGYIKGNIRIISFRANSLKKDGTIEEFEAILKDLKTFTNSQNNS